MNEFLWDYEVCMDVLNELTRHCIFPSILGKLIVGVAQYFLSNWEIYIILTSILCIFICCGCMGHYAKIETLFLLFLKRKKTKAKAAQTKCPSRYHRRRPSNLLQDYQRRQRKNIWLETHIWHAKRFHMKEAWGYNLADYPNDKSIRAAYRSSAHHAILQVGLYICLFLKTFFSRPSVL